MKMSHPILLFTKPRLASHRASSGNSPPSPFTGYQIDPRTGALYRRRVTDNGNATETSITTNLPSRSLSSTAAMTVST